jgi:uncharacterized SAM-binding protein YcdF (DUF218 family)
VITQEVISTAEVLWRYHQRPDLTATPSECIIALGGNDVRVAEHAASLMLSGQPALLVVTGGIAHRDDLLATGWELSEAETFKGIALYMGVHGERIIVEPNATNTAENIRFSRQALNANGIKVASVLVVSKPHMQRRAIATFDVEWPGMQVSISSPACRSLVEYCVGPILLENVINLMVGDIQRLQVYAAKGFSSRQKLTGEVEDATGKLISLGFNKHLIR